MVKSYILIKLVQKQYRAYKETSILEPEKAKTAAFFQTLISKLEHTKINGISSKKVELNATSIKAYCGDKEIFQMDLTR